ncbi:MAG TPA: two-component regulator propeller domain-containing protein, partial [bacterium]|nr:two-component regulator propeller domain-containing protein [bacterium]
MSKRSLIVLSICFVAFLISFASGISYAEEFTIYTNPFASGEDLATSPGWAWFKAGGFLVGFSPLTEDFQLFRLPSSYPGNQVVVDTSGAVWVHCRTVICRVLDHQLETFLFTDVHAGGPFGVIAAAPDGSVWAANPANGIRTGIVRFDGTSWSVMDHPAGLEYAPGAICFAPDGTGWFAWDGPPVNEHQLGRYRDGEWEVFDGLAYGDFVPLAIAATDAGDVWLAIDGMKVYHIRNGEDVAEYRVWPGTMIHPTGVAIDTVGRVWVPSGGGGVAMFDGENWTTFNTLNSGLPSDNVNGVDAATDGTVWFTTGGGLAWYYQGLWNSYTGGECTVMNNNICSVAVDGLGRTFYGTYFGQVGYSDGVRWKELYNPGTTYADEVYDIEFWLDGTVWLACQQFLKGWKGTMTSYGKTDDGMSLNRSTNLCLDRHDNLWVCAGRGLARYDGSSWRTFQAFTNDTPPRAITPEGIACDQQGRIWVGTPIGLAGVKNDQLDQFLPQYEYVHTIACDNDGMLWLGFGSSERGVLEFDGENEVAWYTMDDGLPSNRISCIECDADNNIWVGTNDGLGYFDGTEWTMWDIDSGLAVNEIRDISIAPSGDVWFATPAGLLCHESGVKPPGPTITIGTDSDEYHAGDTMTVALSY